MLPPVGMLATKIETQENGRRRARQSALLLALLSFALALTGCGPPGAHELLKGKKLLDNGDYAGAADEFRAATEIMTTNAQAWNYLGVAEQHAGQFEEAASAYKRALELDRDLTQAHYNLGCLWLEQNKPDDAISEFTAYTLRRVNEPDGWLKLGLAQLRVHDVLPAEKSFSTALYLSPNNAEALNGLGLARMQRGLPQEAVKFFQAALRDHPDYAPAILNLATVEHDYLHNDRFALDEYRAYLALNPHPANWDEVNAIVNSMEPSAPVAAPANEPPKVQTPQPGAAPREEQAFTESRPAANRPEEMRRERTARSESPREREETPRERTETPTGSTQRQDGSGAGVAGSQPNYAGGEDYSSQNRPYSQPAPDNGAALLRPGNQVHIDQPAPPAFPRYLYLNPQKPAPGDRQAASVMFARARRDEADSKFADALDNYRRAAQMDPSWFEAQYNCGVMAYRLRDYQFSLAAYERALAIEPESTDARYNFAFALKAAGDVTDAIDELKKIVATNANDARVHLELGNLYAQDLHDVADAREEYLKVLQLDPGNPQASNIEFWLSANPQ